MRHLAEEPGKLYLWSRIRKIDEDSVIIVEASKSTDFSYVESFGFSVLKKKEYKTNLHLFLALEGSERVC